VTVRFLCVWWNPPRLQHVAQVNVSGMDSETCLREQGNKDPRSSLGKWFSRKVFPRMKPAATQISPDTFAPVFRSFVMNSEEDTDSRTGLDTSSHNRHQLYSQQGRTRQSTIGRGNNNNPRQGQEHKPVTSFKLLRHGHNAVVWLEVKP
jgi:hypothetical protein